MDDWDPYLSWTLVILGCVAVVLGIGRAIEHRDQKAAEDEQDQEDEGS